MLILLYISRKIFWIKGIGAGVCRCELHACMLTISRLRRDEGTLQNFDPEVGRACQKRNMGDEDWNEEELNFCKTFYTIED